MPVVKGSKQIRMVVVPYRPWRVFCLRLFVLLVVLATGGLAFLYGYRKADVENGYAQAELEALRLETQAKDLEGQQLRQQIVNLEQTSAMDRQALDNVQQTILSLREQISVLEEDVLFYKQIMSPENTETGLVIGQLDLEGTGTPGRIRYKLELKQQGNNENVISGHANITIIGLQNDEEMEIPLAELTLAEVEQDIRLQFRYFQNIEGELALPGGFEPTKVQIVAVAEGANGKTVQKSFGWIVEN